MPPHSDVSDAFYQVRGFDPATQRFQYQVNPRFGSSSLATSMLRTPFRVPLDLSIDLGRPAREQAFEQSIRLQPTMTGTRAPRSRLSLRPKRPAAGEGNGEFMRLSSTSPGQAGRG